MCAIPKKTAAAAMYGLRINAAAHKKDSTGRMFIGKGSRSSRRYSQAGLVAAAKIAQPAGVISR